MKMPSNNTQITLRFPRKFLMIMKTNFWIYLVCGYIAIFFAQVPLLSLVDLLIDVFVGIVLFSLGAFMFLKTFVVFTHVLAYYNLVAPFPIDNDPEQFINFSIVFRHTNESEEAAPQADEQEMTGRGGGGVCTEAERRDSARQRHVDRRLDDEDVVHTAPAEKVVFIVGSDDV